MINARSGRVFTAILTGAPTGLVGTLGIRITTTTGTVISARKTSGINEVPAGSGTYATAPTAPVVEHDTSYLVTWDDGATFTSEELRVSVGPITGEVDDIVPEPAEVAALLRARTYEDEGEQEGEWSDKTRPTLDQAEALIEQAAVEVNAQIGATVTDEKLLAFARGIVAIRAAMLIELSYYPEQADEDQTTVYRELKALYDERLKILLGSLPDSNTTQQGMYSLRLRSDILGAYSTAELLP